MNRPSDARNVTTDLLERFRAIGSEPGSLDLSEDCFPLSKSLRNDFVPPELNQDEQEGPWKARGAILTGRVV